MNQSQIRSYAIQRNEKYDFGGESYGEIYPNLHKYPATMIPQLGIEILKDLNITQGRLLDPYCGSGSSFISALHCGINDLSGNDLNPLALMISRAKCTYIANPETMLNARSELINWVEKKPQDNIEDTIPKITNRDYWFSQEVQVKLAHLKQGILKIIDLEVQNLFLLAFSSTVRECSYTRNSEFKLYRIPPHKVDTFKPDVSQIFLNHLEHVLFSYLEHYRPHLTNITLNLKLEIFSQNRERYDVVLTSPPYGDSRTTVAYGQFSALSNEWLDFSDARKVDKQLMGGITTSRIYHGSVISDYLYAIDKLNHKRALEVSAFYRDLEQSIQSVSNSVRLGGKIIYIVGNRRVKGIQLPTDQFIAEQFERAGCRHLVTYERQISNKVMPSKNSPSNVSGQTTQTMSQEFIVICEKVNAKYS